MQPLTRHQKFAGMSAATGLMLAGIGCCAAGGFELNWLLALGVALVIAGLALQAWTATRSADGRRASNRRYAREFFWAMGSYIVIVAVIWPQVEHVHSLWLKIVIAVLPIIPTIFVARAMVRRIRGGDELEQRVHLQAAAIAGLVVGLVTFCAGFLEVSGVLPPMRGVLLLVWPLMCAAWGISLWWARRRYQ